jgi:hypothetical protein
MATLEAEPKPFVSEFATFFKAGWVFARSAIGQSVNSQVPTSYLLQQCMHIGATSLS